MTIEDIRDFALSLPHVTEDLPFDEHTLVFRIGGKIFMFLALDRSETAVTLKCDPERAIELRERYQAVTPGYHCNKKHWNTVVCNLDLSRNGVEAEIVHAYTIVRAALPKKVRVILDELA